VRRLFFSTHISAAHKLQEDVRAEFTDILFLAGLSKKLEKLNGIDPNAELWTALEKMGEDGIGQMPVMRGDNIVGMLSRGDIVQYLQTLQQLRT